MSISELIEKIREDISECKRGEKRFAKEGAYQNAIEIRGMRLAYQKVLWQLKKIKQ